MSAKLTPNKIRLNVGDTVIVMSGSEKGKTGKITTVHPRLGKVTVEGVNVVKKHVKPSKAHPQGDIIDVTRPIWTSKVAMYDLVSKKHSKIGYKIDAKGNKTRVLKRTGKEIK